MKTVGLRELKNRLSRYIRDVRSGHTVAVTDRGHVVAELRPPSDVSPGTTIDPALARLVNRNLLVLGAPNAPNLYPRLRRLLRHTTAQQLLDADRGER
jgi:antitoxin (DNA-binding transcriptional repressor) of toxin-antitoxin stability system